MPNSVDAASRGTAVGAPEQIHNRNEHQETTLNRNNMWRGGVGHKLTTGFGIGMRGGVENLDALIETVCLRNESKSKIKLS